MAKSATDYFVAGRRLGLWVFVLAATATSFSGWTFMGHPGLITVMVSNMLMPHSMQSQFLSQCDVLEKAVDIRKTIWLCDTR